MLQFDVFIQCVLTITSMCLKRLLRMGELCAKGNHSRVRSREKKPLVICALDTNKTRLCQSTLRFNHKTVSALYLVVVGFCSQLVLNVPLTVF